MGGWRQGSSCASGILCSACKAIKKQCHPHCWNAMHAVHRVYFKREGEGEARNPLWRRPWVHEVGSAAATTNTTAPRQQKNGAGKPFSHPPKGSQLTFFPPLFLGGKWSMTIHQGCLVFKLPRGNVEGRCEMEGWGLGEVKGQRKKGGTFSEDGWLEGGERKKRGNNDSHV